MIEFKLNKKENELAEKFLQDHRHPDVYKGAIVTIVGLIYRLKSGI